MPHATQSENIQYDTLCVYLIINSFALFETTPPLERQAIPPITAEAFHIYNFYYLQ